MLSTQAAQAIAQHPGGAEPSSLSMADRAAVLKASRQNRSTSEYGNVLVAVSGVSAEGEYSSLPDTSATSNAKKSSKKPPVVYDRMGLPPTAAQHDGYDKVHSRDDSNYDIVGASARPGGTIKVAVPMELSDVELEGSSSGDEVLVSSPKIAGAGRNQYESVESRLTLSALPSVPVADAISAADKNK